MANRLEVLKTYKLYIGGQFPRTESGRYYNPKNSKGEVLGNICLASRKDFRNAVVAARKAQGGWEGKTAFNRGQILYRIAENLEGRKKEFIDLIVLEEGLSNSKATDVVNGAIDLFIYYAGWADKYQQIFSSVNPVSSSHFNFSMMEATGVVGCMNTSNTSFLTFVGAIAAIIVSGNTLVCLANETAPLSAITLAEVFQHSDLSAGVVNILTGKIDELKSHFASHMDVNALLLNGQGLDLSEIENIASGNLKRVRHWDLSKNVSSPYCIKDFLEVKTTWHPIEQIGGATAGY